jgi:hypothetical protein
MVSSAVIARTTEQPGPRDSKRHELFRDYETRSKLKLKAVGTHRYATWPDTEVLCCAYAVDDQPVKLWRPGNEVPLEFIEAAKNHARGVPACHRDLAQLERTWPESREDAL